MGVERVGIDDDFFAVGGDSLRSIQVVARAEPPPVALRRLPPPGPRTMG
ncbi:phosphopantetheine-binding protein [Streptomyces sp. NPDC006173]